ncbi:NUDIX hydrolase [Nitrospina watsonii]|uniref:NUDIX hydrolase n=1 Tax=Nitrospina watsonii TaxID=1323948 RepID=A0ABN8VWY0_9BACT|nr:NUDIX domain-containing protein [Nitrospina watsonii]CAI2718294.1 NUDIX hydrolase [Nitrospina watsonii]
MDDGSELFDVVDVHDQVVGQATRREVHAQGLLHRSVHILVFNDAGELFLQKRSMNKDENPGYWDTSAAGHVSAGDDYWVTAHRELEEELGIRETLTPFTRVKACPETFWEHVECYTCTTQNPIRINPDEIDEGRFWPVESIQHALNTRHEAFTSSFRLLFAEYLKKHQL